jgi:hypothetical protein
VNYDQARQNTDGGWAWTSMNDGRIRTAGGCVTWPEGEPVTIEDALGPNPKPMGPPHSHATKEEAERCHWRYELGKVRLERLDLGTLRQRGRCDVPECPNWEDSRACWPDGYRVDALCEEHATVETVIALHPFEAGMQEIHS